MDERGQDALLFVPRITVLAEYIFATGISE
jgi:hypothetical protein